MNAQDLAQKIFDMGYTDSVVANYLGVTREHLNKVRNGKRQGSEYLAQSLQTFLRSLDTPNTEVPTTTTHRVTAQSSTAQHKAVATSEPEEVYSTWSWLLPLLIVLGFIGVLAFAMWLAVKRGSTGYPDADSDYDHDPNHAHDHDHDQYPPYPQA
jgi:transcriptional regulator with XRE-family HTH domain